MADIIDRTLGWLDGHATNGQERLAIRWLWANYRTYGSPIFRGCHTRKQVLVRLENDDRLLAEVNFGPRRLQHLRRVMARVLPPALEDTHG